jgi:hypothetical protein
MTVVVWKVHTSTFIRYAIAIVTLRLIPAQELRERKPDGEITRAEWLCMCAACGRTLGAMHEHRL